MLVAITMIAVASLVLGMGLPVTAAYIVLGTLSAPALFNLIADAQIVEILTRGTLPEEAKALMMIVAPDKLDLLNQPMPIEQARAFLAAVPPDLAGTLRDMALAPEVATFALLSAQPHYFLAQPGQQCHTAGLSRGFYSSSHIRHPANVDRSQILENSQGTVYCSSALCLHSFHRRQLAGDFCCFLFCPLRSLCLYLCPAGTHGKQYFMAAASHFAGTRLLPAETDSDSRSSHRCSTVYRFLFIQCQKIFAEVTRGLSWYLETLQQTNRSVDSLHAVLFWITTCN